MIPLEILWYLVIGAAAMFYVVLDGFDMGVGMLHLFTKDDTSRRIFLNSIGPVWDGNELWLVIVGGALLAGFPAAYATIFSSFYTLAMLGLAALIFRSAAIEFRSKRESPAWRKTWDILFSIGSYGIAFGLGVVLGNLIQGIPIDGAQVYQGTVWDFLGPYPLTIGVFSVFLFMMHGSLYLLLKTEGALYKQVQQWARFIVVAFMLMFLLVTIYTLYTVPYMTDRMLTYPIWFVVPIIAILAILNIPRQIAKGNHGSAFFYSSLSIMFLFILYGVGTFPMLLRSSLNPDSFSLTLFDSASSALTLKILLVIVLIGLPLIIGYGFIVYRIFRGKVKLGPTSY